MKIVCYGDSLALPREGCNYNDTWIAKLKFVFPSVDFICNFNGGMLINDIFHAWNYMKYTESDIVIIQEGICDCAPRYVNDKKFYWKVMLFLCEKTGTSNLFWWLIKKRHRNPSCTYTTIIDFSNKYDEILNSMYEQGTKHIIIIKIGHGAPSVVRKSSHFNSNVDAYNKIFDQLKEKYGDKLILIDPLNHVDENMFVDGYHCNSKGMDIVYRKLEEVLNNII